MWVKLHRPFGDGKKWEEIELPSPAGVNDLLAKLRKTHPRLKRYFRDSEEETFHHLILIRGDYVLKAEDEIEEEDRIVVMMPLTGG
jgi:sulfur carrier protein ThiS